jgi:hypothetical protein
MNYAQELANSIYSQIELNRVTEMFKQTPSGSVETTLSYAAAKALGFEIHDSHQGRYISLPKPSQFGDH